MNDDQHETDRYQQLVAEKLASRPDRDFQFNGDDWCHDGEGDCSWDGESRRCNCGNRRVYWESRGEGDDMTIYAQAW